ncbi:MAG: hypothetical protein AAF298_08735 [Cyanobacteria bacterium P01_A01_bin.40]
MDKSISIQELKTKLAQQSKIRLGIYSRRSAEYIYQQAITLKLNAVIVTV